ncbi:MAG: NTP transferase domain-containing protein [Helicobacteraceae bacterium]|nr:NTP transferase domain-containing protein [Helicobacteraceae bacterium]
MKALLLAAGLGTRLRPITDTIPKCLVPINGKPLLEYWLNNLSEVGITDFLINTSYLHKSVEEYVKQSKYRDKITLVYEEELLDTGGTLLANRSFFNDESFMLIHADNMSICNFNDFIDTHKKRAKYCEMTMMIFRSDNPSSCGIVELDNNKIVQKFHEKVDNPPSNLANGAVYICEPSIFNFLEDLGTKKIDFSNDVIPHFTGKIGAFINDVYHRDIGSVESYALVQIHMYEIENR